MGPSWQSVTLISYVLRTLAALFNTLGEHLIAQQEWFISLVISSCESGVVGWNMEDCATPSDSFENTDESASKSEKHHRHLNNNRHGKDVLVGEIREIYLETIVQLCRDPSFFTNLYLNHDGNINSKTHLFDKLLRFFSKFSFPDVTPGGAQTNSTHQNLCMDAVLIFLRCLVERRKLGSNIPELAVNFKSHVTSTSLADQDDIENYSPEAVVKRRIRKRILLEGAEKFNKSFKVGIQFFQEHGFLPAKDNCTPTVMADFLCRTPNLSKSMIGEYIAKPGHSEVLIAFSKLYDFSGKRIDEAMRIFLERFRIPGESQQIERIMEAFSKQYFASIQHDDDRQINSEDDTGVLAFSIIMLNTDQHNPAMAKRRMTFEDYTRNVRGLNSGKNFAPEYLKSIYDAIKKNEIILAEEHGGELGFNFQWRELMKKHRTFPVLTTRDTNCYDKDLLLTAWGPIVAALFHRLENADDNLALQKAVMGIQHCAILSAHYSLPQIIDFIIISLSRTSGFFRKGKLLPEEDCVSKLNGLPSGIDIMPRSLKRKDARLDRWIFDIGRSYRTQVSGVLMFNLAADYSDNIHEGWKSIVHCIKNMFLHQILPPSLLVSFDYVKGSINIPRIVFPEREQENINKERDRSKAGGLFFSTISQLLSITSNDEENYDFDFTGWDESQMISLIGNCNVEQLLGNSR